MSFLRSDTEFIVDLVDLTVGTGFAVLVDDERSFFGTDLERSVFDLLGVVLKGSSGVSVFGDPGGTGEEVADVVGFFHTFSLG